MPTSHATPIRRLVLVRPAKPTAPGVRRLLLARRNDALLPAPPRPAPVRDPRAP